MDKLKNPMLSSPIIVKSNLQSKLKITRYMVMKSLKVLKIKLNLSKARFQGDTLKSSMILVYPQISLLMKKILKTFLKNETLTQLVV
jgi:hypothetical protein